MDLVLRLIKAADLRSRVLAANLANQNTPAYTRRVVSFEDSLRDVLQSGGDISKVKPTIGLDAEAPSRPDGNNVSLELEMNAMRENRILYDTYIAMLQGHFSLLEHAITGN